MYNLLIKRFIFNKWGDGWLDINFEFRKGIFFIRLEGILNEEASVKLSEKLDYFINTQGVKYFVINLEKVLITDYSFFSMLEEKYKDVKVHDGKLIICGYNNSFLECSNIYQTNNELMAFKLIEV